jgi:hypothetical protein
MVRAFQPSGRDPNIARGALAEVEAPLLRREAAGSREHKEPSAAKRAHQATAPDGHHPHHQPVYHQHQKPRGLVLRLPPLLQQHAAHKARLRQEVKWLWRGFQRSLADKSNHVILKLPKKHKKANRPGYGPGHF